MRLYISTPINGRTEDTFKLKWYAAKERVEEIKSLLRRDEKFKEYDEMVSTFNWCKRPDQSSEPEAIGRRVQAVLESDAVFVDDKFMSSKGCREELNTACIYGIKVYGFGWEMQNNMCCNGKERPMDYRTRMAVEYQKLEERTNKLSGFMQADKFMELDDKKQKLMQEQYAAMCKYMSALGERCKLEGVYV